MLPRVKILQGKNLHFYLALVHSQNLTLVQEIIKIKTILSRPVTYNLCNRPQFICEIDVVFHIHIHMHLTDYFILKHLFLILIFPFYSFKVL